MANAGYYMCAATNRAGTDIKAIQIKVIRKFYRHEIFFWSTRCSVGHIII